MIRSKFLQLAVATALLAGAQSAMSCSLAAWTGAATTATTGEPTAGFKRYSGKCSMRSASAGQFVTDGSPNGTEATYNARFYVFTGNLGGGEADIFQAQNTGGTNVIRVTFDGAQFKFYSFGTANTAVVPATANRYYGIEVRWAAAGTYTAIVRGAGGAATTVTISGGSGGTIDTARLGWISGGALTGGTNQPNFDEFDSRRTSNIGFLCRGDVNGDTTINIADRGFINQDILAQTGTPGTNLASGQPDVNEDGNINLADRGNINALIIAGTTCANQ